MESSDHAALMEALAPDVVLRSPIVDAPFEGKEEAGKLFEVLIDAFEEIEYVADSSAGDVHVLAFRVRIRGEWIEGVDLVRFDEDDLAKEITVFLRPLSGIAAFSEATAVQLAKRLGGSAGALRAGMPAMTLPLKLTGRLAPRLLGMRRARRR